MQNTIQMVLIVSAFICTFALGATAAFSQMIPPPPAIAQQQDGSFTARDRAIMNSIFRMTRAIHTKLFPLSEEQKILNGGTVDMAP